jgi:hypothetical protein
MRSETMFQVSLQETLGNKYLLKKNDSYKEHLFMFFMD